MSKKDLRILFSTNGSRFDAVHVFANRNDERQVFDVAFAAHRESINNSDGQAENVISPRQNVLVYYGLGGIGKTTLSRELQIRIEASATNKKEELPPEWPPLPKDIGDVISVRVDFAEAGTDFESVIIALRAALSEGQVRTPAFDVAFARYWAITHPNQDLADYLRHHSRFGGSNAADRIPFELEDVLADIATLTGIPLASVLARTSTRLANVLRDKAGKRHALKDCPRLPSLLEANADLDSLSYYPHLLSCDLERASQKSKKWFVVFLDTFENVGRTNRELERLIQRVIWLMPNTFFVITGRNRVDWNDRQLADQLDWVGPVSWPGLDIGASRDPRQHLVGFLSDEDAHAYLRARLTVNGEPAIPEDIRAQIVRSAKGMPLYLDLSVLRFVSLTGRQQKPELSDFEITFPSLVARVFRDLSREERQVLRGVSLVDSFDVELAISAAGQDSDGPALRLVQRSFVDYTAGGLWPYHIHELLRSHLHAADIGSDDSWSQNDWHNAAGRILNHIGKIANDAYARGDRRVLIDCLNQGLRLAHEYDLEVDWLTDGAYWFIEDSVWEPSLRPRIEDLELAEADAPSTAAQTLAAGLVAIVARQRQHRSITAEILRKCLSSDLLEGDARDLLKYFYAECMRDLGHYAESEEGMRSLIGDGRMSDMASRGLSHLERRTGRFRDLYNRISATPIHGVWFRVLGDVMWAQGRLHEAVAAYTSAVDWASRQHLPGEVATSGACLAYVAGLDGSPNARQIVNETFDSLSAVKIRWAELQAQCAEALLDVGDSERIEAKCEEVLTAAIDSGLTSTQAYAHFIRAYHYAVIGDDARLLTSRQRLREVVNGAEFSYLCEIVDFWLGDEAPSDDLIPTEWVDGTDATRRRWITVVENRRRLLGG